jgi:hypothetical protein
MITIMPWLQIYLCQGKYYGYNNAKYYGYNNAMVTDIFMPGLILWLQ